MPALADCSSVDHPIARWECRILWIDDEIQSGDALLQLLAMEGIRTDVACSGSEGVVKASAGAYDAIVLDLRLRDIFGLTVLERLAAHGVSAPVLVATGAYLEPEMKTLALRAGAAAVAHKPFFDAEKLTSLLRSMMGRASGSVADATSAEPGAVWPFGIVAASRAMQGVVQWIRRVGPTNAAVLITGETGTGKELVARALHDASPRAAERFVTLNCGAIPEHLAESELFGHRKGAFTGAAGDKEGLFDAAHRGTLFLDELGELPLPMQARLLRCLDNGEVRRVGDTKSHRVDVRIIAATNRSLSSAIADSRFRQDLYYRLAVAERRLPVLRERPEDIPALVAHLLPGVSKQWGKRIERIEGAALNLMRAQSWPGNVRELRNVLGRAVGASSSGLLTEPDISGALSGTTGLSCQKSEGPSLDGLPQTLAALQEHQWNRTKAAHSLGINRSTLRRRLKRFGLWRREGGS